MIKITDMPPLTEEDKLTIAKMKGSEMFLLFCKILSEEYLKSCAQMAEAGPHELQTFQGTARGLMTVFNMLMHHASKDVPPPVLPKREEKEPKEDKNVHKLPKLRNRRKIVK